MREIDTKKLKLAICSYLLVTSCILHIVQCHISVDTLFRGEDPSRNSKCESEREIDTKKLKLAIRSYLLVTSCILHIVQCHTSVDTLFRGEDPSTDSKC